MATYSSTNGIKLISTGDEAGTWGTSSNVNWQITDVAANGFVSIALAATTYTLPVDAQPSAAQDGHYKAIKFTGTPGGTCTVTLEQNDRARMYMLVNSTNQTIIVTQGSGANVTISAGDSAIVLANGAGSGAAVELFSSNAAQLATIAVTVADPSNVGNRYYIDGALQQTVEIKPSITYRFDQSDTSNAGHPLRFSATADGTHATPAGTEYTTGVVTVGTPGSAGAFTQITLEQDAPQTLYYYCSVHPLMGGTVLGAYSSILTGVTSAIQTQIDGKQPVDATLTALAGLATGVDKIPYSTDTDIFSQLDFKDEDDMVSDSATAVSSQQSVKAYVDAAGLDFQTPAVTTSGSFVDFDSIPSTVTQIYVYFIDYRGDPTVRVQLKVGGTEVVTGYASSSGTSAAQVSATDGFIIYSNSSGSDQRGMMTLHKPASGIWVESHSIGLGASDASGGGTISGLGTVDGIRIKSSSGNFVAGKVSVSWQ
tara:strand:- start:4071 stop:5516 length:1446 start_codon:yes stop_codon:yes gene_type:complete